MARKTLYLIDGHAQIYRAYYAPFGALTSPSGEPTRAVHVFMQMLLNLLRDRRPDYLVMTMDVSDKTVFRVDIDPQYKANRQASPEDLGPQIERIVSILQAMKVPILRRPGFEADDVIATLCRRFADDDLDIIIVSKDKDLDQLLGDRVRMYDPGKDRDIDVGAMIEAKGYGPDQAVEAQMLMGDSTDNIKGVLGVGPKKAAQLLPRTDHGALCVFLGFVRSAGDLETPHCAHLRPGSCASAKYAKITSCRLRAHRLANLLPPAESRSDNMTCRSQFPNPRMGEAEPGWEKTLDPG